MILNGLFLVDKETGCTSHDVVARARRLLGTSAIGHCGTLDPMASGLMVLLVGQATKLSDFILSQNKRYLVRLKFGQTSDTGDATGQVVQGPQVNLTGEQLSQAIADFQGDLSLAVPKFSAVKIAGKKLYEYARAEQEIASPVRQMRFFDARLVAHGADWAEIEISCTKGGYIRSWGPALGERLGVGALVAGLRRLESAPYSLNQALTLEQIGVCLAQADPETALGPSYIPIASALPGLLTLSVKGREEQLLRHGQISHELTNRLITAQKDANRTQLPVEIKILGAAGALVGLLSALPSKGLKIRRIFPE